jgi:putative hydrolase of the HAD superfamily
LKDIKTIIFDLGGVIIDLDIDRTIQGFSLLSGFSPEKVKSIYNTDPIFHDYEKGLLDDNVFRDNIRNTFDSDHVADDEIDHAWNAMLLGIPAAKLKLMGRLKERYQVLILSNTNNIHVQTMYNKILPQAAGVSSFDSFVHKAYYSHVMRMRKPDADIFQYVLDDFKLKPGETVFLDDNADNIKGAALLSIKVKHITNSNQLFELFD